MRERGMKEREKGKKRGTGGEKECVREKEKEIKYCCKIYSRKREIENNACMKCSSILKWNKIGDKRDIVKGILEWKSNSNAKAQSFR